MNLKSACFLGLFICPALYAEDSSPVEGDGQLGAPISWIDVPGTKNQFYMAQRSRDGRLLLTPNEAFFPKKGLTASGIGGVKDVNNLNGGKTFKLIENWNSGDVAEWGIHVKRPGKLTVKLWMSALGPRDRFTLQLDESKKQIRIPPFTDKPGLAATTTFVVSEPGIHLLKIVCDSKSSSSKLHWIDVAGEAAINSAVLRKRWRPAAAHTKFSSSSSPENVRMWVMEMDAVPGELGFYSPITTPFGYYGPTWKADGTVNSSFNFSLWSFGRGKSEPPVAQLSHLLAIGNPQATFGGFDHEGTGVKIRNWEPLAGRQGQKQVIALRVESGKLYDTYYSYFYESDHRQWRLFGVGNKYNNGKPLKSLWVGSFVEVPGPPHVQRTGPYERTMRYRGWVMDGDGGWHPLDRMSTGNVDRATGLTHTDRGVTSDGWFFLQTGGWTFRKATRSQYVKMTDEQHLPKPDYLGKKEIQFLTSVPSAITVKSIQRRRNDIQGTFDIRDISQKPQATLFWGTSEGLTFVKRWEHQKTLTDLKEGKNSFSISGVDSSERLYFRLLLKNSEGQFWTTQTVSIDGTKR